VLDALDPALAWNVLRQVMVEILEPAGFGAARQKRVQKIQVRQRLRQLKFLFSQPERVAAGSGQAMFGGETLNTRRNIKGCPFWSRVLSVRLEPLQKGTPFYD